VSDLELTRRVNAFEALKNALEEYYPISHDTWEKVKSISRYEVIEKNTVLYSMNEIQKDFGFIYKGLIRVFILDKKGNEYNKFFFDENTFPGPMVALLTNSPSQFELAAIEHTELIRIDFQGYRKLLFELEDLKLVHIHYLEKNWLIANESREVSLVQRSAAERYEQFLQTYPNLESRLKQYHIASHLGITPTQLCRVRRNMKKK
jgi:CRP-like cAMP-binding protein